MADPVTRRCKATTRKGEPCKATGILENGYCMSHQPAEVKASLGFVPEAGKLGGRPRRPREIELIQQVADEYQDELRRVLAEGLTASQPIVVGGNSKDARVELVPDSRQQLATFREIMDRLHGKARQTTEISGPDGGPMVVASSFDLERLSVSEKRDLLGLLEKAADA